MADRRIVFLSMPIEALLDILTGRATAKLPEEIPPEATLMYSFIEPENQVMKIALTHETFDSIPQGNFIKTHRLLVEIIPNPAESDKPEKYTGETLIGTEQWHRDV